MRKTNFKYKKKLYNLLTNEIIIFSSVLELFKEKTKRALHISQMTVFKELLNLFSLNLFAPSLIAGKSVAIFINVDH